MLKKSFLEKNWKKCLQGMMPFQRSREKNHFKFFCSGYATQNKALDMIKLVSKLFFFH